jgi:predicted RNase H-like HicB family nuclease
MNSWHLETSYKANNQLVFQKERRQTHTPALDLERFHEKLALLRRPATIRPWRLKDMKRQFDVVIEQDSDGYFVASVPALPGCHTQAKSLDSLMERTREAIELCLEVQDVPPEPLEFIGVQRITIAA